MWCATQQTASSSWRIPQIQVDLWCDVQHRRLWAAAKMSPSSRWSLMWCATQQTVSSSYEVHKFRMISDVMRNTADCEQQLKKSTTSGWSLMWCATQQTMSSSWRSPHIQVDLGCDVQHSRLRAAAEEVHKFRMISDVMCNTADCEQQLKNSTNSGWSLMWCATQQTVNSNWSPEI